MRREPLQGRDREQALLLASLDAAANGHGAVAVISGPAGIGKSALAEALAEVAEGRRLSVVRGRAWEFADAPPYFPASPVLRSLGVDPAQTPNPFALWERVLERMASVATGSAPLVWVLEDLHAADLLTLDLLVFLAQPVRSLPVCIIVTTRDADARIDDRVAQRLARLRREGVDLRLNPLSSEDVTALAERWRGRPLRPGEGERLVERSEGNPLFVIEMARSGTGERLEPALPQSIRQLVQERVSRLPTACQRALAAGAIVGREFAAGTVAHMLGVLPARAVDELAPAVRAGLLGETRPGMFVFGHVLERDAVEDGLSATERFRLHGAAETALSLAGDESTTLVERVRHALSGGTPENEAHTLSLVDSVLGELTARGAYDRALSLFARLDEARRTGLVMRPAGPDELLRRATLAQRAGRFAECRRVCDDVMSVARKNGDACLLGRAALVAFGELRPGIVDPEAVATLEAAFDALDGQDVKLRCRVEARLTSALQPAKEPFAVADRARGVIARARATGDEELLADVLVTAGAAIVDYVPVEERRGLARELAQYAERRGDGDKLMRARSRLALDTLEMGDFAGFYAEVDALRDLSMELGHPRYRGRALLYASMRACMRGKFAESERYLVEVDQLAALSDDPALSLSLGAHRSLRARETENPETLHDVAGVVSRAVAPVPDSQAIAAVLRAGLFARAGDRPRTVAELERVEQYLPFVLGDGTFAHLVAEAAAFAGTEALCRAVRGRIESVPDQEITTGHVPVWYEGSSERLLALLDATLGDDVRAERRLRTALARARLNDLAPWVARMGFELGKLLERRGELTEARALLSESGALATELGMPTLAMSVAPKDPPAPAEESLALERDGETWRVFGVGRDVRVRDTRGMRLLARLVEQRGAEIHVLVLASDEGAPLAESNAGERIDETALRAYRARLVELATELDEAESTHDRGRAERLSAERAALEGELRGALGLGGNVRKAGSVTERARVNVQRRLKDALTRIGEVDAALGRRFTAAVRTGTYCSFRP